MVKRSIADIKEIILCDDIERLAELIGWGCKHRNRELIFDTHYSDAHPFWMVKSAERCFRKLGNERFVKNDDDACIRKDIDRIVLTFYDWATMTATKEKAVVNYNHGFLKLYITAKHNQLPEIECKFGIKGTDFIFDSMESAYKKMEEMGFGVYRPALIGDEIFDTFVYYDESKFDFHYNPLTRKHFKDNFIKQQKCRIKKTEK